MFGVGVKYRRPFLAMAIGGFVGGLYAGITHVGCYAFASPGFLGGVAFLNGGTANTINGTIACYCDGFHGRPALPLLPCTADQKAVHCELDWRQAITE